MSRHRQVHGVHSSVLAQDKSYLPAGDDSDPVFWNANFQLVSSFAPCPRANTQTVLARKDMPFSFFPMSRKTGLSTEDTISAVQCKVSPLFVNRDANLFSSNETKCASRC